MNDIIRIARASFGSLLIKIVRGAPICVHRIHMIHVKKKFH